jgi:hypothetical protein
MRKKMKTTSPEQQKKWLEQTFQAIAKVQSLLDAEFASGGSMIYSDGAATRYQADDSFSLVQSYKDGSLVFYGADSRTHQSTDDLSVSSIEVLFHWLTCSLDQMPMPERFEKPDPRGMVINASGTDVRSLVSSYGPSLFMQQRDSLRSDTIEEKKSEVTMDIGVPLLEANLFHI